MASPNDLRQTAVVPSFPSGTALPSGSQHRIDFERVNRAALNAYPGLLSAILPGGRIQGREFVCAGLSGKPGRSLSINLQEGVWKDFATGDSGSDPVSLWAAMHNCSQVEAARMLGAQLGMVDGAANKARASAVVPRVCRETNGRVAADKVPDRLTHPTLGPPDAHWVYKNTAGQVIGVVCRWDHSGGGKTIRPFTPARDASGNLSWHWRGWSEPRPLYRLNKLAACPDVPVLVVEGEKSADAAQKLFPDMAAVTWPHGAESAGKADFSPLRGRTVYVWPDSDAPGLKAAHAVCAAALAAGSAEVLTVTPPEGVNEGWDLADALNEGWTSEKAAAWLQANSARFQAENSEASPAFDIEPLDITWCLQHPAPKKVFHVWPYIPAGCVGVLTGTGAVGKSYLTLALCVGVACGHSFGPFEIEQARRVAVVNVEDMGDDLHFRLIPLVDSLRLSFDEQRLLCQNLRILPARGKLGPLMQLDERRNPQPSASYAWLREEVKSFQPDLMVLDTKARLFGLDENSNDHAAQWLFALERLLVDRPELSILVVSHNSKGATMAGDTSQHAARGASSLVDNARFVMTLAGVDDSESKKLGGRAGDFVCLNHAKPNYTRRAEPALFRRGDKGELHPVNPQQLRSTRMSEAVERLRDALQEDFPEGMRARDLERCLTDEAKGLRDRCLSDSGLAAGDWPEILRFGIESLRLEKVEDAGSDAKTKPALIKAKTNVQAGKNGSWQTLAENTIYQSVIT